MYRIARLGLAFFISAWITRYLGPNKYGQLIYAIAISEIIMLSWSQGLKEVVVQQIRENKSKQRKEPIAAFQLMIIGNTILLGVLSFFLFFLDLEDTIKMLSILCGLGIWFRAFEGFELWFHSELKIKVTVLVQFLAQILYALGNVLLIIYNADLIWFGVTYFGQLAITGIGFLLVYYRYNSINLFKNHLPVQKKILEIGSFMILSKLTLTSSFIIDRFVIEELLDIESVGFYSAAMKMVITWIFISKAISLSTLPVLNDEKLSAKFDHLIQKMFSWTLFISIVLVLIFYNFSSELVSFVFGDEFKKSSSIFQVLSLALPLLFLNEGIKIWLIVKKKTKYYIISMISVTIICIILNFILIPNHGLIGAAYSFLASWIFGGGLILLAFKDTRSLFITILKSFFVPINYIKGLFLSQK